MVIAAMVIVTTVIVAMIYTTHVVTKVTVVMMSFVMLKEHGLHGFDNVYNKIEKTISLSLKTLIGLFNSHIVTTNVAMIIVAMVTYMPLLW